MGALGAATVGLTAINAISGYGAAKTAEKAARQQSEYEARIYGIDADLADQQAEDAIARGHEASLRVRNQTRGLLGTQRAAYSASGVDPTTGSARAVQADTEMMSELDRITIENNAAREAYGYKVQASDYRTRGMLALAGGKNQARAARYQGYSTLLGGAAEISDFLYRRSQVEAKK